jgi:hypothetical protein
MTPLDYQAELQQVADEKWPGMGVSVMVQVWQPTVPCAVCSVSLEQCIGDDGESAGRFHRVGEIDGRPIRSPHYASVHAQMVDYWDVP